MTEKASKISCDVPELKCDYSRTETMDMGLQALMATGMVPAGYEFKTNSTPASKACVKESFDQLRARSWKNFWHSLVSQTKIP
jgi:hypothetical protein